MNIFLQKILYMLRVEKSTHTIKNNKLNKIIQRVKRLNPISKTISNIDYKHAS